MNGDGKPDIIVANQCGNDVSVLLNAANGNFTGQAYTIDTIDPFVESINRTTPAGPSTNASHGQLHGHLQRACHRRQSD